MPQIWTGRSTKTRDGRRRSMRSSLAFDHDFRPRGVGAGSTHGRGRVRGSKGNHSHRRSVPKVFRGTGERRQAEALVEVSKRAGSSTPRITAGAAGARRSRRTCRALGGGGKHTELRAQLFAFTLGTLSLVATEDQSFKLVLTFLADVF